MDPIVIGKSPYMLQGPNADQTVLERLNEDISDGRLFHGRAINYRKDIFEFMMEWKIIPIRNEKTKLPITSRYKEMSTISDINDSST